MHSSVLFALQSRKMAIVCTQAEQIFKKICPSEEFLPRAPDPEEIVFDDDVTHGPQFEADEADGDAKE